MTNPSEANLEVAGNPSTDIVDCTIQTTLRDGTYIVYELFPTRKVTVREVDGKVREYNALEEVEIPGFTQEIKQVVLNAFGLSAPLQDQSQMQEEHMESSSSLQLSGDQLVPAISPLTNSDPRVQSKVNQVVPDREGYHEDEDDEGRSISLTEEVREWKQSEQQLFQRATGVPQGSPPPDGESHWSEEHVYFPQATPAGSNFSSGSEEEDGEDEEHQYFPQATPVGSNYSGDPEEEDNEEELPAPFRSSFSFRSSVMSEEEVLQNELDMLTQEHWLDRQLVDD
ncbi:uncharacterized protein [Apostichopus japonicus]|uniref:uncharacterized protein isoform X4 n=1 Tax=Stichopus japonicus TaxID=307972 RepID=UPI003AB43F63